MLRIIQGNALDALKSLPDDSVHCCITSPPYWGLRDYKCEGQLGLEKAPEEYIAKLVEVFREVRRVLRPDGTLWLNLGDIHISGGGAGFQGKHGERYNRTHTQRSILRRMPEASGLKPKDLAGMPWRVALALQADGWWLRSAIPWIKRTALPESTEDRPSIALEYVFLLSKSHTYFFDFEAIKMPVSGNAHARSAAGSNFRERDHRDANRRAAGVTPKSHPQGQGVKANHSFHAAVTQPVSKRRRRNSDWWLESWQGLYHEEDELLGFVVNPQPYSGAHFATFPKKLVEPMIFAGTSAKGCCHECGAPYLRLTERVGPDREHQAACGAANANGEYNGKATQPACYNSKFEGQDHRSIRMNAKRAELRHNGEIDHDNPYYPTVTTGFEPTCGDTQNNQPVPCTVLDPFAGSGTVGAVALENNRNTILIELNPDYIELIRQRCSITTGLALT